jgi:hypothetical protein
MADLKGKTPIFKSINGEMDTGGAPIYADDLVRIQENNRGDILNYFEALRRLLPELLTWDGATQSKQFESGIVLSGLEYDNSDPANPVVSEGYILSGGEVCYYPGGTIATGLTNRGLLYLYKGAPSYTSRTFSVGGSKEILVTHDIVVETGQVTANGLELAGGSAITGTDEVVVLGIGIAGSFLGEDYFTTRTALGITGVAVKGNESDWSAGVMSGTNSVGASLGYLVSRVNNDGTTEIRGASILKVAEQTGANAKIFSLPASNNSSFGNMPLSGQTITGSDDTLKTYMNGISVYVAQPSGGWPLVDMEIIFNDVILATTTLPTPYTYDNAFLDIT